MKEEEGFALTVVFVVKVGVLVFEIWHGGVLLFRGGIFVIGMFCIIRL